MNPTIPELPQPTVDHQPTIEFAEKPEVTNVFDAWLLRALDKEQQETVRDLSPLGGGYR